MDLIFIGDRPAQMCALVLDESTRYTGDKLDPFMVQRVVERFVTDPDPNVDTAFYTTAAYRTVHNISLRRHIVLSTGLTWAPKYDGMVVKQINTLLEKSFVPPMIYVLPVSSRILLGHSINAKLAAICESSQSRRNHTLFLGEGILDPGGFAGDTAYPTQPTPAEVLNMIWEVQFFKKNHP